MSQAAPIVQKLWNYCNVLRDDGVSYSDYVEQLTYLVFLKMAEESTSLPIKNGFNIPKGFEWKDLVSRDGDDLEKQYKFTLESLGKDEKEGMLTVIFHKAQNKIQDPAKLKRLISLIDEEVWFGLDLDVKGDIYEGLLQKNAEDVKSGAGQYFTPRPLIKAMVDVIAPKPSETVHDPACGTGGFFLSAYQYLKANYNLDRDDNRFLRGQTFSGVDIVNTVVRLCTMNLFIHGIGDYSYPPIKEGDSLASDSGDRFDVILTNPPFGKKSSISVLDSTGKATKEKITYERDDFWATSSNKQLNFVQHIKTIMKIEGRAAVVVPDNVLFEGGAGETVRKKMLDDFDLHTILRLPTGIFYAQGVKANVLFFDRKPASSDNWTKKIWYYDLRTNKKFTLKINPLQYSDLDNFITCYQTGNFSSRKESERFKAYTYSEIIKRDKVSLDIFWLKDESLEDFENLPPPEEIASEIVENLQVALHEFSAIEKELNESKND